MNDGITFGPPPVPAPVWLENRINALEALDLHTGAPDLTPEAAAALTASREYLDAALQSLRAAHDACEDGR